MTVVPGDTVPGDTVPGAPGPPARPGLGPNDAWVHVGADGAVTAFTGKVEARPGHPDRAGPAGRRGLGVPAGAVTVVMGDTGVSPFDAGTFGSRSMPHATPALRAAAAAARRLLTEAAAEPVRPAAGGAARRRRDGRRAGRRPVGQLRRPGRGPAPGRGGLGGGGPSRGGPGRGGPGGGGAGQPRGG